MTTKHNPAHCRRMAEPFASTEAANEAVASFFADVEAARDKHRIAEVVVLCEIACMADGEEVRGSSIAMHGDSARVLPMLAREFGAAQARHEETVAKIVARGRKAAR